MALKKSTTAFGATFPDAYHRIEETLLKKMEFDGVVALGAVITVNTWATQEAKESGSAPLFASRQTVQVPAQTASAIVPLAYSLLLASDEFSGAESV